MPYTLDTLATGCHLVSSTVSPYALVVFDGFTVSATQRYNAGSIGVSIMHDTFNTVGVEGKGARTISVVTDGRMTLYTANLSGFDNGQVYGVVPVVLA